MNPTPTPSTFKKFLLPGVIIIGLVIVGLILFMKGGAVDQGAALFRGTAKTDALKMGTVSGSLSPNNQLLCLGNTPRVKIISPNGGEVFQEGDMVHVTYQGCNIPQDQLSQLRFSFEYVPDSGQPLPPWYVMQTKTMNPAIVPGYQTFTTPNNYTPPGFVMIGIPFGKHFIVRMSAGTLSTTSGGTTGSSGTYTIIAEDSSDGLFTIKEY